MLKQAHLVAEHYDLPYGCASSICFYLGNGSPFAVPTSMSASAWPLAFDSYNPSRAPMKTEDWSMPISLPLPSTAVLTGLPICANLCFDFGCEEGYPDSDCDSEHSFQQPYRNELPLRPSATPYYRRSPSWERRTSFQEMPYANLDNSPSPREGRFSSGSTLSPATRRMRTFAFNAELRRRMSTQTASPCFPAALSRNAGPASIVPAATSAPAQPVMLADFIRQHQQSHRRLETASPKTDLLSRVMSDSRTDDEVDDDEEEEEEEDYVDTQSDHSGSASSVSVQTFQRSPSSLFSSTQGTTVWNEDDAIFEHAGPRSWAAEGVRPAQKRHSRLESNKGLPLAQHRAGSTVPFWSISSAGSVLTPSILSPAAVEAEAEAEELRTAQVHSMAMRTMDTTTATMMSPMTATTIVGRGRASTCVERSQPAEANLWIGSAPSDESSTMDGAVTPNANSKTNTKAGPDANVETAVTGLGLSPSTTLALPPAPTAIILPLKTVVVPIINRSPAQGTLARRRALTMLNQPSRSSSSSSSSSSLAALTASTSTPAVATLAPSTSKDAGNSLSVGH
ncbi:hypothetical protein A4X09_0g1835 [Tilletia walkeri]|uniref:Uncharacterized protein n=1 Tax=Tilletia walkeri TaxID=117179 RepID=A0A8X7NDI8_9BASI|nr:hypothetical protein A4X09_0g1835 [Tilletia walkeri]